MNESLAMELVKENAKHARKWFVVAMVELGIIVAIIYLFMTSDISYTTLTTDGGGNANYIGENMVGDFYGAD